jgi:hypothetical protein
MIRNEKVPFGRLAFSIKSHLNTVCLLLVSGPCQAREIQSQHRVARDVDRRRNPALPLSREELASHRTAEFKEPKSLMFTRTRDAGKIQADEIRHCA